MEFKIRSRSILESTSQSSSKMQSGGGVAPSPPLALPQYSIVKDKSRRDIKPLLRYAEADLVAYALNVAKGIDSRVEPSNYSKAVNCDDSGKGMIAMQEEIKSLHKNDTWDLVRLLKGKKTVHCKWVFKRKKRIPGVEEAMYRARLVSKGYSQIPGINFTDVFSLVVKHSLIWVFAWYCDHA